MQSMGAYGAEPGTKKVLKNTIYLLFLSYAFFATAFVQILTLPWIHTTLSSPVCASVFSSVKQGCTACWVVMRLSCAGVSITPPPQSGGIPGVCTWWGQGRPHSITVICGSESRFAELVLCLIISSFHPEVKTTPFLHLHTLSQSQGAGETLQVCGTRC